MQVSSQRATLKSILFADLAQYSRLTAAKELETLEFVAQCFELFRAHCDQFGAEFIKNTGDGVLILFDSASSAIDYALFIHGRVAALGKTRAVTGQFRIGLHLGEVHRRDGDVFGHAINMASRVEALAEPGGVCVTQDVYWAARSTGRFGFRFLGRPALKNMPESLALYHVVAADAERDPDGGLERWISVIDGLGVYRKDGQAIALRSRKAQALIGYLALSSNFQDVPDRVAALIWPDRSPAAARLALTHCIQSVEKAVRADAVGAFFQRGQRIGLNPAQATVDVVQILRGLRDGKIDNLLLTRSDWAETMLLGLEDTSTLFSSWLSVARHNWRNHVLESLEATLDRFASNEAGMRQAASALLVLEPSHERAARCLIRHYAASHELAAAVRVYENISRTLRERYQMLPSSETTALVETLREPGPQLDRQTPSRKHDGRAPILAVGRFEANRKKISDVVSGFRSQLTAILSKFREFTVVELRDGSIDAPDVDYILRAECNADRDSAQIIVSLNDPATNRVVWSDTFHLSLENWLSVQKVLVGKIASTLEVYLSHDRLTRLLQHLPHEIGVYGAWLRGEDLLSRWNQTAEDEAEQLFEDAIAADPNFAPAHASLASVINARQLIRPGIATDHRLKARAVELAQRAVALDPLDARNHLVVGWSTAMTRQFVQSEVHYELAAELNPHSPRMLVSAALGLAFAGRVEVAQQLLARAMTLTSMFLNYQWSHIAVIRYFAGDLEGVVEATDRSQNAIVDTVGWKVAALRKLGRIEEARAALSELHSSVAAIWSGPAAATRKDVQEWFLSALPIRREEDKKDLARMHSLE